ncbi:MAG: DUF5698 domain-containing protein [Bacillota bacterium]
MPDLGIILGYLLVFFARIIGIALFTLRCLFSVKGRKLEASLMGFAHCVIYVLVLGRIITALDDPLNLILYAGGFSVGTYVGSLLEDRMGAGFYTVEMVTKERLPEEMAKELREAGFGVTMLDGEGREGPIKLLFSTIERQSYPRIMSLIRRKDPTAFVTVLDARQAHRGFMHFRDGK